MRHENISVNMILSIYRKTSLFYVNYVQHDSSIIPSLPCICSERTKMKCKRKIILGTDHYMDYK